MPRHKRSSGFSHMKRGRLKNQTGGAGRGTIGRTPINRSGSSFSVESSNEDISMSDTCLSSASSESDISGSFRNALLTPSTLESEQSTSECISSDVDSSLISAASQSTVAGEGTASVGTSGDTESVAEHEQEALDVHQDEVLKYLKALLPNHWIAINDGKGFHILMLSRGAVKAIQRNIFVGYDGSLDITVHRRKLPHDVEEHILSSCGAIVPLTRQNVKVFVDRIISVVAIVRSYEICTGAQFSDFEHMWDKDKSGLRDNNPYDESRYEKTFRTHTCSLLLPIYKWRCADCSKALQRFRARRTGPPDPSTANIHLTEEEMREKLSNQHSDLRNAYATITRLQKKFEESLESSGVAVNDSLAEKFEEIIREAKLTPLQQLFFTQQFKAATVKDKRQMRWHPTFIRFALNIQSTSNAAYVAMRESGFIQLPSERTLFDYSHLLPRAEGCHAEKMDKVFEKVKGYPNDFQKYHTLIMDEIHIAQKLVYLKSSGELVGYVNLDDVNLEMQQLSDVINNINVKGQPPIATKILAYMVRGICSSLKEIVAAYPTANMTKEELYDKTWHVISRCELAGVKIAAVVCDGSGVNRGFFQMHTPVTKLKKGLVFDTVHLCDPDRILYFISDGPHLLKTIRNCFAKSGLHPRSKRKLTKGSQVILWKTIERLYLEDHDNTWRQSYKLNSRNVYLNSYSCMNVGYAAQVLSNTVGQDLKERKWPGTSETVEFILRCNIFFDNINGAYKTEGTRTANERLHPYCDPQDKRFNELLEFVDYLRKWESEVNSKFKQVKAKERNKLFLPKQTVDGIEITVRSFIGVITFMLKQGAEYINGRALCQDPLEQYFGKQRASLGGSHNPTVSQFFASDEKISTHRDTNVRKRGGNTEAQNVFMELSEEPLPKRPRVS